LLTPVYMPGAEIMTGTKKVLWIGFAVLATIGALTDDDDDDQQAQSNAIPVSIPRPAERPLEEVCRENLGQWQSMREARDNFIEEFSREQAELCSSLYENGVRSAEDLKGKPAACVIADELLELTSQIEALKGEVAQLNVAIVQTESLLRRLERGRKLASADMLQHESQQQLAHLMKELEDALTSASRSPAPVREIKVEELLAEIL